MSEVAVANSNPLRKIVNKIYQSVGGQVWRFCEYMGGMGILSWQTLTSPFKNRFEARQALVQINTVGVQSLSLTNLIALFTGMVLALQFIVGLRRFGLELYSGQVVGLSITRELGPVLTALMVAARVGSGIAAEIGSMTVSEQVLAIRAMGGSPVAKLVVPRVLVTTLITPVLTIIAIFIGVFGGLVVTLYETGVSSDFYIEQVKRTVELYDFTSGVAKTFFFGFFIGIIACYKGLNTSGGTRGVGRATTETVVHGAIAIFISDFFLTKFFLLFD